MQFCSHFLHQREIDIKGRRQLEAFEEIESDFENIRVAWNRAIEKAQHRLLEPMIEGLALYCEEQSKFQLGISLLDQALEAIENYRNL